MKYIPIIVLCSLLNACSIVTVHSEGEVSTYRKLGFIHVVDTMNAGNYVELSFSGVGYADGDFVIGHKRAKNIVLNQNQCVVFLDQYSKLSPSVVSELQKVNCNFISSK